MEFFHWLSSLSDMFIGIATGVTLVGSIILFSHRRLSKNFEIMTDKFDSFVLETGRKFDAQASRIDHVYEIIMKMLENKQK